MIENATNLTNTTVRASNGFSGFLSDYWQELLLAIIISIIISIILWVIRMVHQGYLQKRDKKVIYDWLSDKTKHLMPNTVGSPFDTTSWPSTEEISSALDLTEERVYFICTTDKGIQRQEKSDLWPNQELEERWAVRKFVRVDN